MSSRRVTVFGGTGFLGRRIVRHLRDADLAVRIASRHPDIALSLFSRDVSGIESVHGDVNNDGSVARAVAGAWAVVNAVSLYVERGKCTFHSVHVDAAKRIAMLARQAGSETLVHMSGIGADGGRLLPTSVAAVKERRQSLTRFLRPSWCGRLSCSDLVMRS